MAEIYPSYVEIQDFKI